MERIKQADLRRHITASLNASISPHQRNQSGLGTPGAMDAVVDTVMGVLSNAVILKPSTVGRMMRPGRFGRDEPWPFGLEPDEPAPVRRSL